MITRMIREPVVLYETFGMVSNYYRKDSYIRIADTLIGKYGDLLSQTQIRELKNDAKLAEQFTNSACADLDIKSDDVKFFFEPFDTGDPTEVNCIARVLLLSMMGMRNTDFEKAIEETKRRWTAVKRDGIEVFDFTGYGISIASAQGRPMPSLFEQIYNMDYPHKAKMDSFRALDNHEYYIDKLAAILRPYSLRLRQARPKLIPVYVRLANRWEYNLAHIPSSQIFELARMDANTQHNLPTDVGVSLFIFNELGWGFDYVPNGADELTALYIGAAVHPEYTHAFAEKRVERIAEIMRSLADPVRMAILTKLYKESDYCLSIAQHLEMNAGNVSRHLSALYESGLLLRERREGRTYYMVNMETIDNAFASYKAIITKP
ncbi:MAG: winged helix-turn-helix transcriptional regulator [Clostridia bacterium]|nr:winged helix-turn-helix transcriptional regulator [Clostridia bacterium]